MKSKFVTAALLVAFCAAQLACSAFPRAVSSERDIAAHEAGHGGTGWRILVAARSSAFKDAVVEGIERAFEGESVSMNFIGLQDLRDESAEDYDAVILINTCVAWSLDPQVDAFLHRYREGANIVVVTTSGDGHWEPKKQNRRFDTVASASEMARVDEVTGEIVAKVRALLVD